MNDEQNPEQTTTNSVSGNDGIDTSQYISAINEMKQNSVSRDKYNKLKEDNRQLLDALINGGQIEVPTAEEKKSAQELVAEFHELAGRKRGRPLDVEFSEKLLEVRDAFFEETGEDLFLPSNPTDTDYKNAQDVEAFFRTCLEAADGNNDVFEREVSRHLVEYPALPTKNKRR